MRGPILGIAFLLGPCFMLALGGSLSACQITPGDTADAGTDVYIPPQSCDTVGYTCSQCQVCPAVQATCASYIQACEDDPNGTCTGLAMCNDACDEEFPSGSSDCKSACCNMYGADPDGVHTYNAVAQCVYGVGCPQTCFLQNGLDQCAGF